MFTKLLFQLVCATFLIGCAEPALACNFCTMAYFDYVLHPVYLWQLFAVVWFIAACVVADSQKIHSWGLPRTWLAMLIGFGSIFFGWIFSFGPILSLFLLLPPIILAKNTINREMREKWGQHPCFKFAIISTVGIISLFGLSAFSAWTYFTRSPAEFIIAWDTYGPGRSLTDQLVTDPNADLNDIRRVVSTGNSSASEKLVEILAKRGEPVTDFPILLEMLRKAREQQSQDERIEAALRELTGLDLPEKTSIIEWNRAFKQLQLSSDKKM